MRIFLSVILLVYSGISFASGNCETQAVLDALQEAKDLVKHEIAVSNKNFEILSDLEVSLGKMRGQVPKKPQSGVKTIVWVPIKIKKSGKVVWELEQGFMYGDQCMRNRIAEFEAGKKVANDLKKKK